MCAFNLSAGERHCLVFSYRQSARAYSSRTNSRLRLRYGDRYAIGSVRGCFALRCKTPFPSMPISLWNDSSDELYRATYFPEGDDIWHQGDWCIGHYHENQSMGFSVVGRIDGTLNPRGLRFGASDIYAVLGDIASLEDTLAIVKRSNDGEAFVLAVQRASDLTETDEALIETIQQAIAVKLSPRHKPTHIIFIDEFPRTLSGKKVETLIGNAVNGTGSVDTSSLDKPDVFQTIVETIQSL